MSHRFVFLDPSTLFAILRECAPAGARFTFARYGPPGEGVGLFTAALDDDARAQHHLGEVPAVVRGLRHGARRLVGADRNLFRLP